MYLCIVLGLPPPNNLKRFASLGGGSTHKCKCPEVMLKLDRSRKQIMPLHHAPHLDGNLRGYIKKSLEAQVFRRFWRENAKCMACMAQHLLSLTIGIVDRGHNLRKLCEQRRDVRKWDNFPIKQLTIATEEGNGGGDGCH
jgi:hypothetical protein